MHKRTVEAISYVLKNRYNSDDLIIEIIPNKNSDGFWKMQVIIPKSLQHWSEHITSLAKTIGQFYGEELFITEHKIKLTEEKMLIRID